MKVKLIKLPFIQADEHTFLLDKLLEIIKDKQEQPDAFKREIERLSGFIVS